MLVTSPSVMKGSLPFSPSLVWSDGLGRCWGVHPVRPIPDQHVAVSRPRGIDVIQLVDAATADVSWGCCSTDPLTAVPGKNNTVVQALGR